MDHRSDIYIITGEASGDLLASRLMQALLRQRPDLRFAGVGGETMQALGFRSLFPMAELSVMGFWEVVPRLPLILRRRKQVVDDILARQPDVIVTVDSWGFVNSVLKKLRKKGSRIPVVHYVAPQVWAWKKGRARSVARLVDRLMTLWPYEPKYFEPYGLHCDFVGHPIVESGELIVESGEWRVESFSSFKRGEAQLSTFNSQLSTKICILPGSRHSEVKRLAPIFRNVAVRLQKEFPDLFVMIPSVEAMAGEIGRAFAGMPVPHAVIRGTRERYDAFRACRLAVAASGTVTLELATCGAPHLIAYRFSRLTDWMVRRLAKTRYANLINILADRPVIPEFVLNNCREELIYAEALALLRDPAAAQAQVAEAREILSQLKPPGGIPSEAAAAVVLSVL